MLHTTQMICLVTLVLAFCVNGSYGNIDEKSWRVITFTGYVKDAGTDDSVHIQLRGEEYWSRVIGLDTPRDDFERGHHDIFNIKTRDIGKLDTISVKASEDRDGWYLEKIEVEENVDRGTRKVDVFVCHCWFDPDKPVFTDYRVIKKTFETQITHWRIRTVTSNTAYSATDDQVWISLHGRKGVSRFGVSRRIEIDNSRDNFELGQVDDFHIHTKYIGTPMGIQVWAGTHGDGWNLMRIEVELDDSVDKWTYVFECDCWFDSDDPKQKSNRYLRLTRQQRRRKT